MKTNVMKYGIFSLALFCLISAAAQQAPKKITLEDIYKNRKFASKGFAGVHAMEDGEHYSQARKDSLNVYEYKTGKYVRTIVTSKQLIPAGDTTPLAIPGYEFGPGETRLIFSKDDEPLYRYSSIANYYIYDIASGKLNAVSDKGKQRLVSLSPDGAKIAFVRDNNLFVKYLTMNPGDPATKDEIQITSDGKINEVINGVTDWVYEEEFGFTQAFFWSPDSKRIAWYRFDESKVKEYHLTYYGELYPELYKYKYPKAGEDNSLLSIHVRDLASGKTVLVDIGSNPDIYIPRIKWTQDPSTLALYRMNRHQNRLELLLADASSGATRVIYTEESKYYIEITDDWLFLEDKKHFILSSEMDGYRHLYLYDMNGKLVNQVTSGQWEVVEFLGVNEEKKLAYVISTNGSPLERDLASASLDGKKLTLINAVPGNDRVTFTPWFRYYVNNHSDINTPPRITINDPDGKEVREIEKNSKLTETMAEYGYAKAEFFTFTTSDGILLNGWMLKPRDFDPARKYPVLFTIYGGPGSQTVQNSWGTVSSWNQMIAQNGIIMVSVDNRGTGSRGEEFKKCTYLELGKFETLDQIEAAKYLGTLPYVDKTRIGMWGWSFGGYLTLSCLTKGADYFSTGVAVAPVTNWKYYDNIYTERFMRTPKENEKGYEDNSPINHASKLTGKLLLIHGMADDNVHPQNSYDFVSALVAANKQFDEQFYPNSNHGIYSGKNTTFHLYTRMTEFILKSFQAE